MHAQPGRLVGEQAERGRVRLREAEARRSRAPARRPARRPRRSTPRSTAPSMKRSLVHQHRRLRALAAHRAPQALGLAGAEAGERHRDLEHLVLEDDHAERLAQHRLERGVRVGHLVVGVRAQPLAPLYIRVHGAALDRPRPHERDLHREVVEASRASCAAGSASARGSRSGRRRSSRRAGSCSYTSCVVVGRCARGRSARRARARSRRRSARPPTASPARADRSSGSRRPRTSPCPTGRGCGPPSPTAAPGRGRSAARSRSPSRRDAARRGAAGRRPPGASSISARQRGEAARRAPITSSTPRAKSSTSPYMSAERATRSISPAGSPSALPRSRIAPLPAVGRERRHERGALGAVALVHARDQLLADVAREVEVDVGQRRDLLVQEAPEAAACSRSGRCARGRSGSRRSS